MYKTIKAKNSKLSYSLLNIFEILWERKVDQLTDVIYKLDLESKDVQIEHEEFDHVNDSFLYSFCNKIHANLFAVYANVSKEIGNKDTVQLKVLKRETLGYMKLYFRAYEKLTSWTIQLFDIINETTEKIVKEVKNYNLYDESIRKYVKNKFVNYHECLHNVIKDQKFLDLINLFFSSYSLNKDHEISENLYSMWNLTIKVLDSLMIYCEIDTDELSLNEQENTLKYSLLDLVKSLVWSLSKISQSLIKLETPTKKSSEMHENLSKSKLLSGGIKNRFLSIFTKKTSKTIGNLATITGDDKLTEYLYQSK